MADPHFTRSGQRALWRVFSPPVVRDLLRPGGGELAGRLLSDYGASDRKVLTQRMRTLRNGYEVAFAILMNEEAGEYAYKNALLQRAIYSKYGRSKNKVFFEFRTGGSKLDALVANSSLHAVEIKSDLDHLRRLRSQLTDYSERFAFVWAFGSDRNLASIERAVPPHIGLIRLKGSKYFSIERTAAPGFNLLKSTSILEMLRREEYVTLMHRFGVDLQGLPNTKLFSVAMAHAEKIDPTALHEELRRILALRGIVLRERSLRKIPFSLRAAVVPLVQKSSEVDNLLNNLERKI